MEEAVETTRPRRAAAAAALTKMSPRKMSKGKYNLLLERKIKTFPFLADIPSDEDNTGNSSTSSDDNEKQPAYKDQENGKEEAKDESEEDGDEEDDDEGDDSEDSNDEDGIDEDGNDKAQKPNTTQDKSGTSSSIQNTTAQQVFPATKARPIPTPPQGGWPVPTHPGEPGWDELQASQVKAVTETVLHGVSADTPVAQGPGKNAGKGKKGKAAKYESLTILNAINDMTSYLYSGNEDANFMIEKNGSRITRGGWNNITRIERWEGR